MGVLDLFRKASAVGRILVMNPGQPRWAPRNYASFADEGYRKNVVAYQAINRVADAVATIDWEIWRGDNMVEDPERDPLGRLWMRPNPSMSNGEYLRSVIAYLLIAGNSYPEAVRNAAGQPVELWSHRPERMKVVPGSAGLPMRYVYSKDSKEVVFDVDPFTGRSDILHLKMFNPLDDWYGMSPIEAGAFAVDQHNESMAWMQSLLQNSAQPSGALVMKDGEFMGDEQYARLKAEIEDQYSGSRNAGRPMLLEGGLDWKQMAMGPKDMLALDTKFSSARDISLAFGVPPQLLNIPGDNTYSNYKEARLAFYEDTVIPLLGYLLNAFNMWFEEPFNGAEIRPNLDSIPAIAEKRQDQWEMADNSQDLTINERRALKGYPPLESVEGYEGETGNRLLAPTPATGPDAGSNEEKALLSRLAYGS